LGEVLPQGWPAWIVRLTLYNFHFASVSGRISTRSAQTAPWECSVSWKRLMTFKPLLPSFFGTRT